MQHFFYAVHSFLNSRKSLTMVLFVALLFGMGFFASQIKFNEDITNLIPANEQSDVTAKVLQQMNFADKISILITDKTGKNTEDLTRCANQFIDSLNTHCKPYIAKIQGQVDEKNIEETFDFVYNHLPLFLEAADYTNIQNKMANDSISLIVSQHYKSLLSPAGIVSKDFILKDPLGISFMALKKLQQLSLGDGFELQDGFVVTKDKKNLLLFVTPKLPPNETDKNTIFIEKLHAIQGQLNAQYQNKVTLYYFGATPIAVANATQIKADVRNTSLFAAITLILILAFFYRNLATPILIFIPSLFGAAFALAILYFAKGSISAISLGISSILLGETTDYSIYVLTHLRNNKSVKLLYKDISKPLLLCGTTTAITFLCLFFVKSEALKDLGIFASLSVIATSVFSLILIPLLYKSSDKLRVHKANVVDRLGSYAYHKNKLLIVSVLLILTACIFTYSKVTFNNDLSALNYVPAELKEAEMKLENIANISSQSIYLATYADSQEVVLESNAKLFESLKNRKHSSQIESFSSVGGLVLSSKQQQQKIEDWNAFWNISKKAELKNKLIANGKMVGFKDTSFSKFYETLNQNFEPIAVTEYAKVKSFFLEEFMAQKQGLYTISTLVKVSNAERNRFVNDIKRQHNIVVIDRQQTNETFLGSLKRNFEQLINYSFIAIFLILLFAFRRIELVLITILPIVLSWIITSGIMGMTGLQFNIINIIVCTLIFGIGVDYSIFMTVALQKEHTYGKKAELPTYRTSILLSVATTILGIGVLIFAKHPALQSIALIAIIGIFSAVLISFVIQPLVFQFFITHRVNQGKAPFEIRRLVHSILSFTYYGLGGFLLSGIGAIGMKLLPISKKTKLKAFHFLFSKFAQSVLMTNPWLRRKINNPHEEKFQKPAIIIANHTSFLDILAIAMLSPKIVFLVSDWVYNSPIFGKGVRLAGFYPVSNGIDNGIDHLQEKVNQGFSLIIFPEGTRSQDNLVQRFHKGAFYLAEKLNLDIIPILIHGYSEVLPKGDFIINDGQTTIVILKRIAPNDTTFGNDYSERTKKISTFFKLQYRQMRSDLEGVDYFKKILLDSFDFKENQVIEAVKRDLNQNMESFAVLNTLIPPKAKIVHFANDYGQLDVLLSLQESDRKIVSFIGDETKRGVAKTNYISRKRHIQYPDSMEQVALNLYDVMLISNPADQIDLSIFKATPAIILCGVPNYKATIVNFGFEVAMEENDIILLKKTP
ncbi:MAG: MMPL family transporter [Burkholderiales bacterium]|nr:MMPL family transporter [Flavobacterium sp.]